MSTINDHQSDTDARLCSNKKCRKHYPEQDQTVNSSSVATEATTISRDKNCPAHGKSAAAGGASAHRHSLEIDLSKIPGGHETTNVTTYLTTNNNFGGTYLIPPATSPKPTSPAKICSAELYDQMKMEHAYKENMVLQSLNAQVNQEKAELEKKLAQAEETILYLKEKVKKTKMKAAESYKDASELKLKYKQLKVILNTSSLNSTMESKSSH